MSGLGSLPLQDILERRTIAFDDLLVLKRAFYEDGIATAREADVLFSINETCTSKHADWPDFFLEAITDYLVFQEAPRGYLTAGNAEWLIERTSKDGLVSSRHDFDLILSVLSAARWSPVSLSTFALSQVRNAVKTGGGPLRRDRAVAAGTIAESEVELLRRILYAFGGDGNVAVTRDEADVLFDIDELVGSAAPNAGWTDLFAKAVANVMMAASGCSVPSRELALRPEAGLKDQHGHPDVISTLLEMVHENLAAMQSAYCDQSIEERALARLEYQRIEIITHEAIAVADAGWLVGRLGRNGRLSPSERAVVAYLNREAPKVHPAISEAVCRLSVAA
jgi:hypothetical protein